MQVIVDNLLTNYSLTGKGKVVVLLHGWGTSAASFSQLSEALQEKYTVLGVDLPGFGETQTPDRAWDLRDYALFIKSWLNKIGCQEVFAFVGHSFGGSVAVLGVGEAILKPQRLIIIASAGVRRKKTLRKGILWLVAKLVKPLLYLLPQGRRQNVRQRFYKAVGSDAVLLPHMELTFKKVVGQDVQDAARKIKQPTLLIYGSEDKETPVSHGRLLSKAISGSRLEVLPGAGHLIHQEQPAAVDQLIEDFLKDKSS